MSNDIPTRSREIVTARDGHHCQRCGAANSHDTHHRRRRRENADGLAHDPGNLVTLCRVCHAWCHANPRLAQEAGFVVPSYENPLEVSINTATWGWALLTSDGVYVLCGECSECERVLPLEGGMCASCLRAIVCCGSAFAASRAMCDCGGGAATALARLENRMGALV